MVKPTPLSRAHVALFVSTIALLLACDVPGHFTYSARTAELPEVPDFAAAAVDTGGPDPAEGGPNFEDHIYPLVEAACTSCHVDDPAVHPLGGLVLDVSPELAYANLVNAPSMEVLGALDRVEPGEPRLSYLYLKVTGEHVGVGGMGARMPLTGELPVPQTEMIRMWIERGAPYSSD